VFDLKNGGSDGEKRAVVIGGNMAGTTYQDIMGQFKVVTEIRPDIQRPVWHCSLSFPPGESPDNLMLARIADEFMMRMGFSEVCPFTVIRHHDKDHDHIHIVASRIGFDGKVWKAGRDVYKALEITQELEEKFALTRTKGFDSQVERKKPKFSEYQMEARTGEISPKVWLQGVIDDIVTSEPTAVEFCEYLEANGIEVRANLASTGRLNGFSFSVAGIAFKGSNLGKAYTWSGLQARGVSYDLDRDRESLERYAAGTGQAAQLESVDQVFGQTQQVEQEREPTLLSDRRKVTSSGNCEQAGQPGTEFGEASPKDRLLKLVKEAAVGKPTATEFCGRLEAGGVGVMANLASTGRLNGFTFAIDGVTFKGSSLGKAYSWGGLQKQGVSYEPKRDREGLEKYKAGAVESTVDGAERVVNRDAPGIGSPAQGDSGSGEDSVGGSFEKRKGFENVDRGGGQEREDGVFSNISDIKEYWGDGCRSQGIEDEVRNSGVEHAQGNGNSDKEHNRGNGYSGKRDKQSDRGGEKKSERYDQRASGAGRKDESDDQVYGQPLELVDFHVNGRSNNNDRNGSSVSVIEASLKAMAFEVKKEAKEEEARLQAEEMLARQQELKRLQEAAAAKEALRAKRLAEEVERKAKEKAEKEKQEAIAKQLKLEAERKAREQEAIAKQLKLESEKKAREKAEREQEEARYEANIKLSINSIFCITSPAAPATEYLPQLPEWFWENYKFWQSPKTEKVYVFPKDDRQAEAELIATPDKVTFQKLDEKTILAGLLMARAMWPGQRQELSGSDEFKAKARAVAEKYELGIEFTPEPEPEPEWSRPSMGR
jgi:hypothetical protein